MTEMLYVDLDLMLFDGGAGAAGGAVGGADSGGEAGAGAQSAETAADAAPESAETAQETPEERRARYDEHISKYRDIYDADRKADIERAVKDRVRGLNKELTKYRDLQPVLDMLSSRYNIEAGNTAALAEAISHDNALYEEAAMQQGMSVDQYREMLNLRAQVNNYRQQQAEMERQAEAQRRYAAWDAEAAQLKTVYPDFDLRAELHNPETGERFFRLLNAGVGVKAAHDAIHHDEIVRGVAARAVEDTTNKVRNDIAARGQRPAEAGASGTGAVKVGKIDPATLTDAQLRDISRRVMAGERITFT